MNELALILFLTSGITKNFLDYYNIPTYIDLTILTSIFLILLIVKNLYINNFEIKLNKYSKDALLLLLILFILIVFSLLYTSSDTYVDEKIQRYLTVLLGFTFPLLIRNFSVSQFIKYFIVFTTILTIIYLPLFIKSYASFTIDYKAYKETALTDILGSYLTMGYIIGLALILNITSSSFSRIIKTIIGFFLFSVLIATGARGPILAFLIVVLLYIYQNKLKRVFLHRALMITTLVFLVSFFIPTQNDTNDTNDLFERSYNRITNISQDSSANSRLVYLEFVFSKMNHKNIIQGFGFGSYGIEAQGIDSRDYPHNILLEILFELGLIGLSVFIAFLYVIVAKLFEAKNILLTYVFIYLLLNSLKSLSLVDSRLMFGIFAIILIYQHKTILSNQIRSKLE